MSFHNLNFLPGEVELILTRAGIQYAGISNNRINLLCLYHNDKHLGNCSIRTDNGYYKCYSAECRKSRSLLGVLMDHLKISFSEAMEFIGKDFYKHKVAYKQEEKLEFQEKKKPETLVNYSHIFLPSELTSFDPEKFYYTKVRGFTKEFCEHFKIKVCSNPSDFMSKIYLQYLIIPIIDEERNVRTFEARRLGEFEMLHQYFENFGNLGRLVRGDSRTIRQRFDDHCDENKIKYRKGKIYFKDVEQPDDKVTSFKYLLKPKVLYPSNSNLKSTIFNRQNLDFKKRLYVTEGLGSIPKIYIRLSQNVSCTFGSLVSQDQIEILKQFDDVVLIADNDPAGDEMIDFMSQSLPRFRVIVPNSSDEDNHYIQEIENSEPMEGQRYLLKKSGLLDIV